MLGIFIHIISLTAHTHPKGHREEGKLREVECLPQGHTANKLLSPTSNPNTSESHLAHLEEQDMHSTDGVFFLWDSGVLKGPFSTGCRRERGKLITKKKLSTQLGMSTAVFRRVVSYFCRKKTKIPIFFHQKEDELIFPWCSVYLSWYHIHVSRSFCQQAVVNFSSWQYFPGQFGPGRQNHTYGLNAKPVKWSPTATRKQQLCPIVVSREGSVTAINRFPAVQMRADI